MVIRRITEQGFLESNDNAYSQEKRNPLVYGLGAVIGVWAAAGIAVMAAVAAKDARQRRTIHPTNSGSTISVEEGLDGDALYESHNTNRHPSGLPIYRF